MEGANPLLKYFFLMEARPWAQLCSPGFCPPNVAMASCLGISLPNPSLPRPHSATVPWHMRLVLEEFSSDEQMLSVPGREEGGRRSSFPGGRACTWEDLTGGGDNGLNQNMQRGRKAERDVSLESRSPPRP